MKTWTKLIIYYHSGTGNALKTSRWIADEASKAGLETKIYSIDHGFQPNPNEIDSNTLLGFLYPTHGFNLSPAMLKFIRKFPRNKGISVFLMNTRAGGKFFRLFTPGISGTAQYLPMLILKLKGYKIQAGRPMDMPSNWISVHPGLGPKMVASIDQRCEGKARNFINKVLSGKRVFGRTLIDLPLDILIFPITVAYFIIGRFFLAKTFIYTHKCTDCNICVDNCPVGAIKIVHGRPFWTHKCESCMRCMNICPHRAVQTSHLLFTIGIILFQVPFTIWLYRNITWFDFLRNDIGIFLVDGYLSLIALYIIYSVIHYLMRFRMINRIIEFTSLTYWWRRYLAPDIKLNDFKQKVTTTEN
jgi:ferredoxin